MENELNRYNLNIINKQENGVDKMEKGDIIFNYVTPEMFNEACKNLKNGEMKNIFKNKDTEIDIKKVGKKIYKFVNHYSREKSFANCIENMYLKRPA